MNLGGVETAVHYLRKFKKQYSNTALILSLVETGLQSENETKTLTTIASELGFASSHIFISAEESNLILNARLIKKQKLLPTDSPNTKTPRRGGISVFWRHR
jgi:hypothetical protein